MAKLYFKYGSMGSGKSLELIRVAYNYIERGQKILLLSSSLDDRFGKNKIASRTGIEMPCISIDKKTNILSVFSAENKKNKSIVYWLMNHNFLKRSKLINFQKL